MAAGVKPLDFEGLAAIQAIRDVIYRYCRAIDRLDMPLLRTCWHSNGTDSRPPLFEGSADQFVAWVEPLLRGSVHTTHIVSNILVDLKGSHAGAESYWTATLRVRKPDGLYDLIRNGRYLDLFSCSGGHWALERRRSITDWSRVEKVDLALEGTLTNTTLPSSSARPPEQPARDRTDPSYEILSLLTA